MDTEEREEGEMSDESMSVDEAPPSPLPQTEMVSTDSLKSYEIVYRPEKEGLIVEKLERTDSVKIEERARRFGINLSGNKVISQKQIDELYENIGINDGNERHMRFDTLHLKGVCNLSTREIFDYLKDYKPISIEKINKSSCNVVCQDHISAALAILAHSSEIKSDVIKAVANRYAPYYWREGLSHPKSDLILIRFATRSDKLESLKDVSKKVSDKSLADNLGKNPWGDLCKSWGIYDHQEVYGPKLPPKSYIKTDAGIVRKYPVPNADNEAVVIPRLLNVNLAKRLGKRHCKIEVSEHGSDSDDEWKKKQKLPRMRMRADDEEKKVKSKQLASNPNSASESEDAYPSLSIQIDNTNPENTTQHSGNHTLSDKFNRMKTRLGRVDIQTRLGERVPDNTESESTDEDSSSSHSEVNAVMSKVQKAPSKSQQQISSVWSRLDKNVPRTDLRQTLIKSKLVIPSDHIDLRKKLKGRSKGNKSPLRIEIDNEYYESD